MYRILIVDDEALVRRAIIQKIDWQALGFDSVEEAEDGELALEAVRKRQPDIVLTDVRMPFMDGLALARSLAEEYPDILIVMLSGHDEFEYVQEALRSRVFEYLLKPISSAGLTDILLRLVKQLELKKKEHDLMRVTREQLRQSLPLLRERFFHSLISRVLTDAEIDRRSNFLDIHRTAASYLVCVLQIDQPMQPVFGDSAEDKELLDFSAANIILELVGDSGTVFNDTDNRPVILFHDDDSNEKRNTLSRTVLLNTIRRNLTLALKNSWSIGIGRSVSRYGDIALSYQSAVEALSYRLIYGCDRIYDSRDFSQPKTSFFFPADTIHDLLSRLKLEDTAIVSKACADFFKDLRSQPNLSSDNARIVLNDLINSACRTALEIIEGEAVNPTDLYSIQRKVAQTATLSEIEPLVSDFLTGICSRIRDQQSGHNRSLIYKAQRLIDRSYADENLGLNQVAEQIPVSACYLSILFKRETGETFIEYLTRIRMEKAKELLRTTDLKAYQIAAKVGFTDPHYFSICFKKYTGLNPTQYKNGAEES